MLINKFKNKYKNTNNVDKYIDNEVNKFLNNDRLTEDNLRRLDDKIGKEANLRDRKDQVLDDHKSDKLSQMSRDDRRSNASRGG